MKSNILRTWARVVVVALAAHPVVASAQTPTTGAEAREVDVEALAARMQLRQLFDEHHRWVSQQFPEQALRRGDTADATRLTDPSIEAVTARNVYVSQLLDRLVAIDPAALDEDERLNRALLERELRQSIESFERGAWLMAVGPLHGPQQRIPQMHERLPLRSLQDMRDYVARLRAVPSTLDAEADILRAGVERGMTPPRLTVEMVPAQCEAVIRGGLTMLLEPLVRTPPDATDSELTAVRAEAQTAVDEILVALRRFRDFVANEYLPACRETIGAHALPEGAAYYQWCLRDHTTTDLSAEEIHAIGLEEVARIRREMLDVIRRTDWYASDAGRAAAKPRDDSARAHDAGSPHDAGPRAASASDDALFAAFVDYLRTDPRFYHTSAAALLDGYRAICKRIDAELPPLFGTMPRLPYGVRAIPPFMAPSQTTAYYQPGSPERGIAGYFCANTHALDQRPIYEMIPLALHEAVPGHHFQIALAQEIPEQPHFRRDARVSAFSEGWALYAERLGIDMGLFKDPYDDFGRLLYEMWRSCRLVVDTGMHAKGWSRDQAIDFMLANTALSRHNIEREIDRYIAWPGQACSYKIGERVIRGLRAKAEEKLGPDFDVRRFHDAVLLGGALPLTVLEARVNSWIEAELSAQAARRGADFPAGAAAE